MTAFYMFLSQCAFVREEYVQKLRAQHEYYSVSFELFSLYASCALRYPEAQLKRRRATIFSICTRLRIPTSALAATTKNVIKSIKEG